MERTDRKRIVRQVKTNYADYFALHEVASSPCVQGVNRRLANFTRKFQAFTRKNDGSRNALKAVPHLVSLLFGIEEYLRRLKLPKYPFEMARKTIDNGVTIALDTRLAACYDKYGAARGPISYGEALLNCYLDIFITFTVLNTPKEIGAKPSYLVNPRTGNYGELELDLEYEGFKFAFEFQGHPCHYADPLVGAKDAYKLAALPQHSRILIPVNICQLNSIVLETLIANSIKDHLGLHEVLANGDPSKFTSGTASPQQLLRFSKTVQRLCLAHSVFKGSLKWIDGKANAYITKPANLTSVSGTKPAPRRGFVSPDLDLQTIYANLRYVTEIRKS